MSPTGTSARRPTATRRPAAPPTGPVPARRGLLVGLAVLAGFLLSVAWSAEFVDQAIGDTVANALLGHDAKATGIVGVAAGIVFAFVSGLAGTFTACNVAAFGAVGPMLDGTTGRWGRLAATLRPLGWLSAGMVAVSAGYGALVGLVGTRMPQFSTAAMTPGTVPARLGQAMVVFGVIGLAMICLGLAAAGLVPDPLARLTARHPNAPTVVMGMLIGGFLIGRPFPLFRQLFRDAAESGNPLYGAAAFSLQSVGNIVVLSVVFVLLNVLGGPALQRWFAADRRRLPAVSTAALVFTGAFTLLYWDVRLLARLEIIPWYPTAPWV